MKLEIDTEPISANYLPIHIATYLLVLFSFFAAAEELTTPDFFGFLFFLCLGFYISWRYKSIMIERFDLLEYGFVLFLLVILATMFSGIDFVLEEIMGVYLKAILIIEVYLVFYLLRYRRYIYLQILSLLLFLISVILIVEKTLLYYFLVFLYATVWFFIFRFSFLKEAKERASQVISGAAWHERYTEWILIVYFFLLVSLGTVLITSGINRLKPYKIGSLPSHKPWGTGDIDSSLEDANSQRLRDIMKMFDRLESLSIEDKADALMPFSKLLKKDLSIQETLKALLGLIDILKRPGPGIEPGEKKKIAEIFSSLNGYAISRVRSNWLRSEYTFSNSAEYKSLPKAEKDRLAEILNNINQAKTVGAIDNAMAALKQIKPALEKDALASELYRGGLAKIAEVYARKKGSLEGIAEAVEGLKDVKTPISPEFFKEAISLDYNVSKTQKRKSLSEEEKEQLEKLKQELFSAKSHNKLKESEEFSLGYIQRLEELKKIQRIDREALGGSIQRFANVKSKIILKGKQVYVPIKKEAEPHLVSISIVPHRQEVSLGEGASFKAMGTYSDLTKRDVSILSDWTVSKPETASLSSGGRFNSCSTGTTFITATFKGVGSSEAELKVVEPRIVSIEMVPASPVVDTGGNIQLKAIGKYSNLQTEDITMKAGWSVDNEAICDISSTGYVKAKRPGRANILISYQGVKSRPYMLKVMPTIISPKLLIVSFASLIALITSVFAILIYAVNKANIKRLKKMEIGEPRGYIITLYHYLNGILDSYGIKRNKSVSPRAYIKQIDEQGRKTVKIPLGSLTEEFYIARYSSRDIEPQSLLKVKEGYNKVLQIISSSSLLWKNLSVRLHASIKTTPFSIM